MLTKEWPLVGYTLLGQTAVGAFWALAVPFVFSRKSGGGVGGSLYLNVRTMGGIAVLVGFAAALSFFHLGSPFRAVHAMKNLRTSWLSREILLELVFLFLAALIGFLELIKAKRPAFLGGLVILTALSGLAFLYSMAKIYMLDTVPAWQNLNTPLSFFLSAVILGPLTAVYAVRRIPVGLALGGRLDNPAYVFHGFASFQSSAVVVALAAAVVAMLVMFVLTPGVGLLGVKKATLLELPASNIRLFLMIKLALLAAAAALLIMALSRGLAGGSTVDGLLLWALLSAAAAETVGRFLFYGLCSRIGV
jgi:anaerobic dimethyl sulfoxide reductase subunit C (anchor subunit)